MAHYDQLKDGVTIHLRGGKRNAAHKFACCDCGLVHIVSIEARDLRGLKMTTWRDKRATAAMRRAPHVAELKRSASRQRCVGRRCKIGK